MPSPGTTRFLRVAILLSVELSLIPGLLLANTPSASTRARNGHPRGRTSTVVRSTVEHRHATCANATLKLTISPCNPSATTPPGQSGSQGFLVSNNSNTSQNLSIVVSCTGAVTSCSATPNPLLVPFGDNDSFTANWTTSSAGGSGTVTVAIGGMVSVISVTVPPPNFTLDTTTTNLTDQMVGLCANNCFAAATSFSTVPYYTMDTPRSLTLVYNEERAHPRPVVWADVTPTTGTPAQYTLQATLNGTVVPFLNGDTVIYFAGSSAAVRLAGQFDASSDTTGVYTLVVTVKANYGGSINVQQSYTRPLVIVNTAHSPLGRGWTVLDHQQLYFTSGGTYLITDGAGNAVTFSGLGVPAADYSVLTWNAPLQYYNRAYPDGSSVRFSSTGIDLQRFNNLGWGTDYSKTNFQLTAYIDPWESIRVGGLYYGLSYGANGLDSIRLLSTTSGGVRTRVSNTQVTTASDSTVRAITDADGVATKFVYDASGRLSMVIDRRGDTTTYKYDTHSWKLIEVDLPRIAADAGSGTTTNVVPKIKYTPWQTLGVPIVATSSSAPATPMAQSAIHATVTDPIGRVTTMTVDRWGQPLVITDPASRVTTITRSGILPTQIAEPTGGTDTIRYMANTPLVSYARMAGDSAINYHYGAKNQIDSVFGIGRPTEVRYLDATTGRTDSLKINHEDSTTVRLTYNSVNQVIASQDPGAHVTQYHYEALFGNVDTVTIPGNLHSLRQFDAFGRDIAEWTTGTPYWVNTMYDTLNRVLKTWHAGAHNDTTRITYDLLYPVQVVTMGNQVHTYEINALGWLTKRYDVGNPAKSVSFRYDTAGRLTSLTNRRGQRVDRVYDVLDRLTSQSGTDGLPTDTYAYASGSNTFSGSRSGVSLDSFYVNNAGTVTAIVRRMVTGHPYTIAYRDSAHVWGSEAYTTITDSAPGGQFSQQMHRIDYPYGGYQGYFVKDTLTGDGINAPQTDLNADGIPGIRYWVVLSPFTPIPSYSDLAFTHLHQLYNTSFNYPNTARTDSLNRGYTYDSLGRVAFEYRRSGTGSLRYRYSYDELGRLRAVYRNTGAVCTATADTIIGNKYASCGATTLYDSVSYDTTGNRRKPSDGYAAGNRLTSWPTSSGTVTYTYDLDGNVTTRVHSGVTDTFFWSALNQLDSVSSGSRMVRYQYNAFGQLVRRTVNGTVDRYFLWDQTHLLAELNATGGRRAQYIYQDGVDQPLAIATDSGGTSLIRYLYQDVQSNVIGIMKVNTLLRYTPYTPWGLSDSASTASMLGLKDTNRLAWKGLLYEGDSTRLYYVRNRWYDPQSGRFLSEDPIDIAGGSNLYTFAGNDPVNFSDATGDCAYTNEDGKVLNALYADRGTNQAGEFEWCTGDKPEDPWSSNPQLSFVNTTTQWPPPLGSGGGMGNSVSGPSSGSIPMMTGIQPAFRIPPAAVAPLPAFPTRLFGTHWCGSGGAGPTVSKVDDGCRDHDHCFDVIGVDADHYQHGKLSSSQIKNAGACNQQLCDAMSAITYYPPPNDPFLHSSVHDVLAADLIRSYFTFLGPKAGRCY